MCFPLFLIFAIIFSLDSFASHYSLAFDSEDFPEIETEFALEKREEVEQFLKKEPGELASILTLHLGSDELPLASREIISFILPDETFQAISLACPNLRTLDLSLYTQQGMDNINFLQYFPNLEELCLSHASITDFTPLGSLTVLKKLSLFGCIHFSDTDVQYLNPLKGSLRQLNIGFNGDLSNKGIVELKTLFRDNVINRIGL